MQAEKNNFIIPRMIREAKPLLFFYLYFFFFFNSNYSILRNPCGIQVFKVKHFVFAVQNLENLVCKNSFMKKKQKKIVGGTLDYCMQVMASIGNTGKCVRFVSVLRNLVLF